MRLIDLELRPTEPQRALFAVHEALRKVVGTIFIWTQRAQMRRRLLTLDDRMLRDVGITRAQVHGEAEKPFWRV
jgi:uncharacterized protein YjiS (DUF1127 family)